MKPTTLLFVTLLPLYSFAQQRATPQQQQWLQQHQFRFAENKGQITDQDGNKRPDIQYKVGAGKGLSVFVGNGQLHYQFCKPQKPMPHFDKLDPGTTCEEMEPIPFAMYRMDVTLEGANPHAQVIADDKQAYYEHYHTDRLEDKGTAVHTFCKVTYKDVYPNIDWVLYFKNNQLEYDFIIHPGGNANNIKLRYDGAIEMHEANGAITATTPFGSISESRLYTYREEDKLEIASTFKLQDNTISFDVAKSKSTIVIDPTLLWATYFGGPFNDASFGMTCNGSDEVYIGGQTKSVSDIATAGAYQTTYAGSSDVFIAKFDDLGAIQWATYYGGNGAETGRGITYDGWGSIYITGTTESTTAIATTGAYHNAHAGGIDDAYLAKFNSSGELVWATYFGGSELDGSEAVSCDPSGNVYLVGSSNSLDSVATSGAYQTTYGGGAMDVFLAKFDSIGSLLWSTYYGGADLDAGYGVTYSVPGNAVYITGATKSTDHIATAGTHQTSGGGTWADAFLAQFGGDGSFHWGTYLGGSVNDGAYMIASYGENNIYISGLTSSSDSIATAGSYQSSYTGGGDIFLANFTSYGILTWATYYGGHSGDYCKTIACDNVGNIYMAGLTSSTDSIATPGSYQSMLAGADDAFIAKFNADDTLLWATYYGGSHGDAGYGIACDYPGNIYICGLTRSIDSIATAGAYQTALASIDSNDAFLAKFGEPPTHIPAISQTTISVYPNPAKDVLHVRTNAQATSIVITDITGRVVLTKQLSSAISDIDVKALHQGLYLYKVYNDNMPVTTGKFCKE